MDYQGSLFRFERYWSILHERRRFKLFPYLRKLCFNADVMSISLLLFISPTLSNVYLSGGPDEPLDLPKVEESCASCMKYNNGLWTAYHWTRQ